MLAAFLLPPNEIECPHGRERDRELVFNAQSTTKVILGRLKRYQIFTGTIKLYCIVLLCTVLYCTALYLSCNVFCLNGNGATGFVCFIA